MCDQKIKRWELVEMMVPDGSTGRVNFASIPQLRNQANQLIIVKGIDVFSEESYAFSQITNNIPGMPVAEMPNAVLVLYVNGEESVRMIPLGKLNHVQIDGGGSLFQQNLFGFDDLSNVDFDKSYVQFSVATAGPYVIPFGITYLRMQQNPQNPNGALIPG
jgi:hypothetical protein